GAEGGRRPPSWRLGTMTPRPRLAAAALLAAGAVAAGPLLAGCSAGAGREVPTWVSKPEAVPAVGEPAPQLPGEAVPGPQGPNGQQSPGPGGLPSPGSADDPHRLASPLPEPRGLAVLASGADAVVGERPTGRVLLVHADRSPPDLMQTIGGLDASGDGGLLGLALSPAYAEDRLIFAYLTTKTDNRVVK